MHHQFKRKRKARLFSRVAKSVMDSTKQSLMMSTSNTALLNKTQLTEDKNVQVDKTKGKYTKRGTLTEEMR